MDPDIQGLWFGCMNNESVTWKALLWRQIDDTGTVCNVLFGGQIFQQATFTTVAHNSFNLLISHSVHLAFFLTFFWQNMKLWFLTYGSENVSQCWVFLNKHSF